MKQDHRPAPDAAVVFSDGTREQLSEIWPRGPLVLVFLRHFG